MTYYRISLFWVLLLIQCFFIVGAEELLERPKSISVALNKSSFPYHFVDKQGEPKGLMVEFWNAWSKKQNVAVNFVVGDWNNTITGVASGKIDVHPGLAQTKTRLNTFVFSPTDFERHSLIFLHRDIGPINDIAQLTPFIIGVVAGSSHIEKLQSQFPNLQLREYPSRYQLFQAALNKDIVAFASLGHLSEQFENATELENLYPRRQRILYNQNAYHVAVSKDKKALLPIIKEGIEKFTVKEISALEKKWLYNLRKSDGLRLSFVPNIEPFMSLSVSGKAQGLLIDIWKLWAKYTDTKIEFVTTDLYSGQKLVKEQQVDIHFTNPRSQLDEPRLEVLDEFYGIESSVFVTNKIRNAKSLRDLSNKRVGLLRLAQFGDRLIAQYPDVIFKHYLSFQEMFDAIHDKEIDAIIGNKEYISNVLIKYNLQSLFYPLESPSIVSSLYPVIQANNRELTNLISDGFNKIPIEELKLLERIWLTEPKNAYFHRAEKRVRLSEEEIEWRAKHRIINVGVLESYAPLAFFDNEGRFSGINGDMLQLISDRTGLNFHFRPYKNWLSLFNGIVNKEVDMIGNATPTKEREKYLDFSDSYWDMPWVVLHPRRLGESLGAKDFSGKKIAILKGYHLVTRLKQEYPNIIIKLVDNVDEGLLALQRGAVDGLIENIATVSELLKQPSLVKMTISSFKTLPLEKSHFAIRKDFTTLKSVINKGLKSISESERQQVYERWFDINIETGLDKTVVTRVAVQVGIVIFIIILVIVLKNRRLNKEIKRREQLESQMKHMATHDELTGLANRVLLKDSLNRAISFHRRQNLELAVLFLDLDGFKDVNDTYGHDVGDNLLVSVAEKLKQCVRDSDTVVRFGGDEFVLLLTGLHKVNEATFVAEKVLQMMGKPFELQSKQGLIEVNIGCSIGIAMYPNDGDSDVELLKVADTLMYEVKATGKNHFLFNSSV